MYASTLFQTSILERFMLDSANAVLRVASTIEEISDNTPRTSAISNAILFGIPKPSAGDVLMAMDIRLKKTSNSEIPKDVLDAISIAKFGQSCYIDMIEEMVKEIYSVIESLEVVTTSGRTVSLSISAMNRRDGLAKLRSESFVNIGVSRGGDPVVDKTKYSLVGNPKQFPSSEGILDNMTTNVKRRLLEVFSALKIEADVIDNIIKLTKGVALKTAIAWADAVQRQIYQPSTGQVDPVSISYEYVPEAIDGAHQIHNMIRRNMNMHASQLTTVDEILEFRENVTKCLDAISIYSLERLITVILFYSCFKIEDTTKEALGRDAGTVKKTKIKARDQEDILFNLCYFFQIFPSKYVDVLFSINDLQNARIYGIDIIGGLLRGYGPDFNAPWSRLTYILEKRLEVVNKMTEEGARKDFIESRSNLSSPMYVVVSNFLKAITGIVSSKDNFLSHLREKKNILENYYNGR